MNPQTMNTSDSSSLKTDTVFGIVIFTFGVVIWIVSGFTAWKEIGSDIGKILVGIGTPLILWRLFLNLGNLNVISVILLMRKEKLQAIVKDKKRSKKLITESIYRWAQNQEDSVIKVKGVTLNLIFGNTGILKELIEAKKLINPHTKEIQILLLNPYSMNAITRSIQESRPFIEGSKEKGAEVRAICEHTLDQHKQYVLYDDFECTVGNIKDLMRNSGKYKINVECKIYSTQSPSFLLINDQQAIHENLILGKKKNEPEGKLYGILPHFIYGSGEIKDSLESHFDYVWKFDSVPLEDFHDQVEEKYYEINRLFLLYPLQKEIWERQWDGKSPGRSFGSEYDMLYRGYKEFYPGFSPKRILDLGCGDGGGGSLTILKEHPYAKIEFIDISENAIKLLDMNVAREGLGNGNVVSMASDMLTFLNRCEPLHYSLVYANFSIIYMTKIKAIEIYRKIFNAMDSGGIFMLSVWTTNYFKMPISKHGEAGHRPPHRFVRIPMTEDLQVLSGGSKVREGEIRRFYRGIEELLEEFESADVHKTMVFEDIHYRYYENDAILRVWLKKK